MRIFEKSCKIAAAFGFRLLRAPPTGATALLLAPPTAIVFVEYVSSIGRTLLLRKITEYTVNVLVLFVFFFRAFVPTFHFVDLCSFC